MQLHPEVLHRLLFQAAWGTLRYTDYRSGQRNRRLQLDGGEFIRRFLLHVLPKGLMRVRHYGFLANRCRRQRLEEIRAALSAPAPSDDDGSAADGRTDTMCPACRSGPMQVAMLVAPVRSPQWRAGWMVTEVRR
ncbi:MAG: transposase [Ectothiorhodospiraceae bacterium]|nr:transposase [Ectothiorhodospiraceae bacterium]